jgi:hypothetical protein
MNVVERAELIIARAEVTVFNRAEFTSQTYAAHRYRSRWRVIGLLLAMITLSIGLVTAQGDGVSKGCWFISALLLSGISVMISRHVYRKRSPW